MKDAFLTTLTSTQADALSRLAKEVQFAAGESIFRQRETANGFFLIETGEVNLEYELPGGKAVPIQKLGPGELDFRGCLNRIAGNSAPPPPVL